MYLVEKSNGDHGEVSETYLGAFQGQVRHITVYWDGYVERVDSRQATPQEVDQYDRLKQKGQGMHGDTAREIIIKFRGDKDIDEFAWAALVFATASPMSADVETG